MILQVTSQQNGYSVAQRLYFPPSESTPGSALPPITLPASYHNELISLQSLFRAQTFSKPHLGVSENCPPGVDPEAWEAVQPWLMPNNHPCKAKLDRMASEERFILNPKIMKQAGFPRAERVGRWSRVCASTHHDMPKYFFKVYHDCEVFIKYDWKRWVHRCQGADLIRECIKKNHLETRFKAPRKWIYAWPTNGKLPPNSSRYVRKNFLLVCDNMRICEHKENERLYKKKVDPKWMDGIYTVLQECGLYDSVYCFNIPFNKDGCICIIDTEYWHKWKVPFERLTKCYSKKYRPYWEKLTKSGKIPDGINSTENLPRQDRRDH